MLKGLEIYKGFLRLFALHPACVCEISVIFFVFRYTLEKLWAIPHNSKCRYGKRGAADAVPQLPERCLSRKAGIVRCCL